MLSRISLEEGGHLHIQHRFHQDIHSLDDKERRLARNIQFYNLEYIDKHFHLLIGLYIRKSGGKGKFEMHGQPDE